MPIATIIGCAWLMAAQSDIIVTEDDLPQTGELETIDYDHLRDQRMTIPVRIGDQGPFRFIIDTGSERTVISRELAERLSLDASEDVMLTSLFDVKQVPTVIVPDLGVGRRNVGDIQAPALERGYLGAEGVLGIDALENQHVVLDFEQQQMTLRQARSRNTGFEHDVIVVRGRTREGRLVVTDARVDGTRIYAIVDTGSSVSIGNNALRDRLVRRGRLDPDQAFEITAVTGTTRRINYTIADSFHLGDIELVDLPIAFSDAEIFRQLDLLDRPAILLGMNALKVFERVSIDFAGRRLRIEIGSPDDRNRQEYALFLSD